MDNCKCMSTKHSICTLSCYGVTLTFKGKVVISIERASKHSIKYDTVTVTFKVKGHGAKKKRIHKFIYYLMYLCVYRVLLSRYNMRFTRLFVTRSSEVKGHVVKRKRIHNFLSMNNCN